MTKVFSFICVGLMALSCTGERAGDWVSQDFAFADKQLRYALTETESVRNSLGKTPEELPSPRNIQSDGSLRLVRARDWCSGFFPGELWYMYEYTKDDFWKKKAEFQTELLEPLKSYRGTHDLGFMLYCSYGNGYRMEQSDKYKQVLLEGANSLASRFNPAVGCIRSWDHNGDKWQYPVIIDNMMNLELLFEASKLSGDSTYYNVAVKHADTTMKNHFRANNSCYHVVDYDPVTGEVRKKQTAQGYADESAWARGQAWAIYGYTMCYRYTHDQKYLDMAEKIYNFIFNNPNLPEDLVPYWDFDAPNIPNEPRDVSAAACTASALYELSTYIPGKNYKETADKIMENLASPAYRAEVGTNGNFILMHSVGSIPHGAEIDVPLNYADYYFLEGIMRKRDLESNKKLF